MEEIECNESNLNGAWTSVSIENVYVVGHSEISFANFPEKYNLEWIELIKATFKRCYTLRGFLSIMLVLE